jgi:hypothetical protein
MNRLRRTSEAHATLPGRWTAGGSVRSVYAPEPLDLRLPRSARNDMFMIWIERLRPCFFASFAWFAVEKPFPVRPPASSLLPPACRASFVQQLKR